MCRVEERVYISADGHRSKFEDTFPCDKSRKGRLCADVKKRTTEYYPKKGSIARSDTPSPINPPTPTGSGAYIVQPRRPSSSGGRPSTRDGQKALKPEIIIEFGGSKSKGKKYPSVSVSTKAYKRSSLGASSNDDMIAVDSPGSDVSNTVHTGFIEAPLAPYGHSDGYGATPAVPHSYHHRHTSSTSSYTGSSRTPSLYITSDPELESTTTTRNTRLPPAIHNPSNTFAPSSPSKSRANAGTSSNSYNTTVITPHGVESRTADGYLTHDYQDMGDRSASSRASSGASGKSRRGKEPERTGRRKDDERKRQEELAREVAESLAQENKKQVRFEVGRAESRATERAENLLAQKEKDRAAVREEARQREQQQRDDEAARERKRERERSKIVPSNSTVKRQSGSRRGSMTMTRAERDEQQRLLAADLDRMQNETRAAEAREQAERAATLRQQQQDTSYYNPRTGGMPSSSSGLVRRDSQSRRNSFTSEVRPNLGRSNSHSRRTSIIQPNPPQINTQVAQTGYARPPSARTHQPPPVSFPSNFNNNTTRPPSARRPSFSSQELPFTAPSARGSGSSMDNPFAAPLSPPTIIHQDPWDARSMVDALPAPSRQTDGRYTMQRRGEDVLSSAAQRASRALNRSAFESDSDDNEVTHGHGRRRR
ncbi:hypothetical protein CC86DRAFT_51040 [Ophiobolus disseminans]|uniref:Uncharacterized protein n=1 Tax=Ophiobolus disseminans TaxID=1469910 RepID=A0A6A6ZTK1_9PLEO|nr:hypothetical protein CC86DRAFT_51040 [Ophiobolus disseminans]